MCIRDRTKTARNFGNHKFSIRGFTVDDNNYLVDGVAGIVYARCV